MRSLLRKSFGFVVHAHSSTNCSHIHQAILCAVGFLSSFIFPLQITSWNTQKMIQSLSSPLSRWVRFFKCEMWLKHSEMLMYFIVLTFINIFIWNFFQIISDLLHFKGSHKHEFDSRWKSFNLVKKSMENRVRLLLFYLFFIIICIFIVIFNSCNWFYICVCELLNSWLYSFMAESNTLELC